MLSNFLKMPFLNSGVFRTALNKFIIFRKYLSIIGSYFNFVTAQEFNSV